MPTRARRRLWSELRRRHVPRVAAYYVAGAWIAAQAADLLLDAFDLGHYTRYAIAVLTAGFPIAIALAWRFDITPRGIVRTSPPAAASTTVADAPLPDRSIAVLPLANLSDDPANEYFSDGLAEEIRNQLARVPGLRVAARRSSFAFKGRNEDVREIGRRLNVATLLEGGVRKHADTVRIDVQLVSAEDGYHLWSQSFERRLDDVFRLQTEVATAILSEVGRRYGLAEWALPAPEARQFDVYNAYLLGRHHFHRRTESALLKAAECFEHATALDPRYALAYSGLADTQMLLCSRYYGTLPVAQAVAQALPYAQRALALAPDLAEAHASVGLVELNRGAFAQAERSLAHALQLNPGYTMAHVWMGLVLLAQGRYREAAANNRSAFRIDPLSPIVNANVGFDAWRFGDQLEAEARFRTAMEIDPQFAVPCSGMARLTAARGDFAGAMLWIDRAIERAPSRAFVRGRKALLLLQAGDTAGAADIARQADALDPGGVFDPEFQVALAMASHDRAGLERIASGAEPLEEISWVRAQAHIALGQLDAAQELYDRRPPDPRAELDTILNDDWTWRLPHSINHAHLMLRAGRDDGHRALERVLDAVDQVSAEGIRSAEPSYWAGSALTLLGRGDEARQRFAEARERGWRNDWWESVDWNASQPT